MTFDAVLFLSLFRAATAALGAVIVAFGYKAYRQTRRRNLMFFTAGILVLTVGFGLQGLAFELLDVPLATASAMEAAFTLVAFGLLVWSLFATERHRMPPPSPAQPIAVETSGH